MAQIIIIGAGITGLTTARLLLSKGHSVTILEARDRIGGRIHSFQSDFSRPVEAGAEFIHGKQPFTLKLLKEARQKKTLIKGKFYTIANDQLEKGDMLDDHWKKLFTELNKLDHDITLAAFLKQHFSGSEFTNLRERVKRFAEGFDIADVGRVSAMALREEWSNNDDEHQYHPENGYGHLIKFLKDEITSSGGQIIVSEPVAEIDWSEGKVTAASQTGKFFKGDKIIITVPLGILQKKLIRFTPALPGHEDAIASMGFGGVIKFLFEFKKAFWEDSESRKLGKLAFVFSDAEIPTWWSQLPDKTPLLTGWFSGPDTFNVSHNPDSLYQKAIQSLQYIFRNSAGEIESAILHSHIADWVKDPFSVGAYSYPTVKSAAAIKFLSAPVAKTIYFAGEALYHGPAMGTVEAALVSAENVSGTIDS